MVYVDTSWKGKHHPATSAPKHKTYLKVSLNILFFHVLFEFILILSGLLTSLSSCFYTVLQWKLVPRVSTWLVFLIIFFLITMMEGTVETCALACKWCTSAAASFQWLQALAAALRGHMHAAASTMLPVESLDQQQFTTALCVRTGYLLKVAADKLPLTSTTGVALLCSARITQTSLWWRPGTCAHKHPCI